MESTVRTLPTSCVRDQASPSGTNFAQTSGNTDRWWGVASQKALKGAAKRACIWQAIESSLIRQSLDQAKEGITKYLCWEWKRFWLAPTMYPPSRTTSMRTYAINGLPEYDRECLNALPFWMVAAVMQARTKKLTMVYRDTRICVYCREWTANHGEHLLWTCPHLTSERRAWILEVFLEVYHRMQCIMDNVPLRNDHNELLNEDYLFDNRYLPQHLTVEHKSLMLGCIATDKWTHMGILRAFETFLRQVQFWKLLRGTRVARKYAEVMRQITAGYRRIANRAQRQFEQKKRKQQRQHLKQALRVARKENKQVAPYRNFDGGHRRSTRLQEKGVRDYSKTLHLLRNIEEPEASDEDDWMPAAQTNLHQHTRIRTRRIQAR